MTGARLLAWEAKARARAGADGLGRAPGLALVLGVLLAAAVRLGAADDAHTAATVVLLVASASVLLRAPGRAFWTPEAALFGRLPLEGRALRARVEADAARAGLQAALVATTAEVAAWHGDAHAAIGGVVLAGAACVVAALLAPTAAGGGAALATSSTLQRQAAAATGAGGPRVVFLAFVPALASAALAVWTLSLLPEAGGGPLLGASASPKAGLVLMAGPLVAVAVALACRAATARSLERATGRVAALDEDRLAHVELERARGLERLVGAGLAARLVYEKDVAGARRRWPIVYVGQGALVVLAWGIALAAGPATTLRLGVLVLLGIAALAVVLGRLVGRPPVEAPRLLATLPLAPGAVRAAKLRLALWRAAVPLALAAPALAWRVFG